MSEKHLRCNPHKIKGRNDAWWFEGEHTFDHPSCVIIRKALGEGCDA